jgi:hypothetical protein
MKHLIVAVSAAVVLCLAGSAYADVENGTLPAGTAINVAINSPADGATLLPGAIPVTGSAGVGTGVIVKDTSIVFVVDRSGSMGSSAGVDCTGDGTSDTRLVCVRRAVAAANAAAADPGSAVADVGLASFSSSGVAHDVDLATAGTQLLVSPSYDGNANGTADLEDVANALAPATTTCYACGLNAAKTILAASTRAHKILVMLSDGQNNVAPNVSTTAPYPASTVIKAFALGSASEVSCASDPFSFGSLDDVAALVPTGSCVQITNFADVADVISAAIGSKLLSVDLTVDGNPLALSTLVPPLPQDGPASSNFTATTAPLAAGSHTICATAHGSDAGGNGSIQDCHTILINTPPDCSALTGGGELWPPNHKFHLITVSGVTDADGDPVTVTITGVTQDEALDGLGDGDTAPDAQAGSASNEVSVRAERSGLGDGRVYRIAVSGADTRGGNCTGSVLVTVPHDQSGAPAVDSGLIVDSFGP